MKIYNSVNGSIYCDKENKEYGPCFDYTIYLHGDYNTSNYTCSKAEANQCYKGFNKDYELINGERNFSVGEVEIYKVNME